MIALGSRLELFTDDYLIERIKGDARLHLHQPVLMPPEHGRSRVCYTTILHEDGRYRRYQRTVRKSYQGEQYDGHPGELTEYLESNDGIRWRKPRLGLYQIDGSRHNNCLSVSSCGLNGCAISAIAVPSTSILSRSPTPMPNVSA